MIEFEESYKIAFFHWANCINGYVILYERKLAK